MSKKSFKQEIGNIVNASPAAAFISTPSSLQANTTAPEPAPRAAGDTAMVAAYKDRERKSVRLQVLITPSDKEFLQRSANRRGGLSINDTIHRLFTEAKEREEGK
jgi:hypothetical protein